LAKKKKRLRGNFCPVLESSTAWPIKGNDLAPRKGGGRSSLCPFAHKAPQVGHAKRFGMLVGGPHRDKLSVGSCRGHGAAVVTFADGRGTGNAGRAAKAQPQSRGTGSAVDP